MKTDTTRPWRRLITLALIALATATVAACGNTPGPRNLLDSIRNGQVVLGTKFDYPGLGLRHPDKSFSGFEVDVLTYIVNEIADARSWKRPAITWREAPSAQRETLIRNGEIDVSAAVYSINASRAKKVAFAGPLLVNQQGLLARTGDRGLNSLTDLQTGKALCSASGSTSAQNVKAQLPGVQLQQYDTASSCVEALHQKKIDALSTDEAILAGYSTQYPGEFQIIDMTYPRDTCIKGTTRKAGTPFSVERYGIGLPLGMDDARAAINEALRTMILTGAWERALRDSLGDDFADRLIARDGRDGFTPRPGDLSFLDSAPTPCEGA